MRPKLHSLQSMANSCRWSELEIDLEEFSQHLEVYQNNLEKYMSEPEKLLTEHIEQLEVAAQAVAEMRQLLNSVNNSLMDFTNNDDRHNTMKHNEEFSKDNLMLDDSYFTTINASHFAKSEQLFNDGASWSRNHKRNRDKKVGSIVFKKNNRHRKKTSKSSRMNTMWPYFESDSYYYMSPAKLNIPTCFINYKDTRSANLLSEIYTLYDNIGNLMNSSPERDLQCRELPNLMENVRTKILGLRSVTKSFLENNPEQMINVEKILFKGSLLPINDL